jgi:hypothetical protein
MPELPGVFRGLLNGVQQRGDGGVFFVRGEEGAYMFAREFTNAEFAEALQTLIDDTPGCFFVVEERDAQLHVLRYDRARVGREALAATAAPPRVVEVDE